MFDNSAVPTQPCAARLVWSPEFTDYDFGPQHPLRPERLVRGLDLLERSGLWQPDGETLPAPAATRADLERVHASDYVEVVERLDGGGDVDFELTLQYGIGPGDNPSFPGIHRSSALIAGGSLAAARGVLAGDFQHAFNPAGGLHHAMRSRAAGFCVYNDVAVAIAEILRDPEARVLYLDFDAHHGDGVQTLFYSDPRVLTFSIHESGRYLFPGTGSVDELGSGLGYGFSANAPMEPFTHDDSWLETVLALVPSLADAFEPSFLVTQHGCDGHAWDPLTHLGITTRAMAEQAQLCHALAHRYCAGRWIGSGGGGYDFRRVVPRMYALVYSAMANRPLPETTPPDWRERWADSSPDPLPAIYVDEPEDFPPHPRAAEIAARNRDTVRRLREQLPLLKSC